MSEYSLSIITPDGTLFQDNVRAAVVPGLHGSFGVLKNHAPIVCTLKRGVVKITLDDARERFFAIDSGILEVDHHNQCLVLASTAEEAETREQALERALEINT